MALEGAVEGLAALGGTGGGGKGLLKLDVFLLSPEHEDVGLLWWDCDGDSVGR